MSKQANKPVVEVKSVPGLLNLTLEHEVKSTKYTFRWEGPKISREEWQQVLAFFKWTYDTTKSESQVRLYVNHREGVRTWRAWAFPQKANTGMTARELDTPEAQTQRAQFGDADGWLYFGTVHHHCSASAFQSGTDLANEQNQDGIHITVGHMDKEQHDIDARMYIGGRSLEMNLAMFWDTTGVMTSLPAWIHDLLPKDASHRAAKRQMGEPAPADCVFPEQWKQNLIHEVPAIVPRTVHTPSSQPWNMHPNYSFRRAYIERAKPKNSFDLHKSMCEIKNWMKLKNEALLADKDTAKDPLWEMENVVQLIYDTAAKMHDEEMELFDILCRNDILPEDYIAYIEEEDAKAELLAEIEKGNKKINKADFFTKAEMEEAERLEQWNNRGW